MSAFSGPHPTPRNPLLGAEPFAMEGAPQRGTGSALVFVVTNDPLRRIYRNSVSLP